MPMAVRCLCPVTTRVKRKSQMRLLEIVRCHVQKVISSLTNEYDELLQRITATRDTQFGDYQATGESVIELKTTARELRGKVQADRTALTKAADTVSKRASTIRQALTARDNAVKELVEASLQRVSEGSDISRAAELCTCYKLIGPQIANDVNITLKTLLANIGAFQKAIHSFEKEVASFNRRLQDGLNEVR